MMYEKICHEHKVQILVQEFMHMMYKKICHEHESTDLVQEFMKQVRERYFF